MAITEETMLFRDFGVRMWFDVTKETGGLLYRTKRVLVWSGAGGFERIVSRYNVSGVEVRVVDTLDEVIAGEWNGNQDD